MTQYTMVYNILFRRLTITGLYPLISKDTWTGNLAICVLLKKIGVPIIQYVPENPPAIESAACWSVNTQKV